jgi:transcriptional regulator with XRE-family HTH domain
MSSNPFAGSLACKSARLVEAPGAKGGAVVLLRKVIGDVLRARRLAQHRTLREVSTAANVSLGYLSEIERGHKEASSELLAAICDALGAGLSDVLSDVSATFALVEQMEDAFTEATKSPAATTESSVVENSVTDGDVTVSVRSDGPLRTTLTTKRTPGPRHPETLFIG